MLVMVLERISSRTARPLEARKVPDPVPGQGELLLRVLACAVCRTDLHLVDGELDPRVPLPRIPGHQVVGTVAATGPGCVGFSAGALVPEALAAVERGATVVMRRHPHERYSRLSLRHPVARTGAVLGGQPDPCRWRRLAGARRMKRFAA